MEVLAERNKRTSRAHGVARPPGFHPCFPVGETSPPHPPPHEHRRKRGGSEQLAAGRSPSSTCGGGSSRGRGTAFKRLFDLGLDIHQVSPHLPVLGRVDP